MSRYKEHLSLMKLSENDRRVIIREQVEEKIKRGEYNFLNNFHANLPCPNDPPAGGYRRNLCVRLGIMDRVYGSLLSESGISQEAEEASDLLWNQTPRDFYHTIDTVIEKLHIPMDELLTLQGEHRDLAVKHFSPTNEEVEEMMGVLTQIYDLTWPVYVELRVMGYSAQDLAG